MKSMTGLTRTPSGPASMIATGRPGLVAAAAAAAVRLAVAAEAEAARELDARRGDHDPVADPDRLGEDPVGRDAHQPVEAADHRGADALLVGVGRRSRRHRSLSTFLLLLRMIRSAHAPAAAADRDRARQGVLDVAYMHDVSLPILVEDLDVRRTGARRASAPRRRRRRARAVVRATSVIVRPPNASGPTVRLAASATPPSFALSTNRDSRGPVR